MSVEQIHLHPAPPVSTSIKHTDRHLYCCVLIVLNGAILHNSEIWTKACLSRCHLHTSSGLCSLSFGVSVYQRLKRFHCADEMFAFEIRPHRWDINQHSLNTSYCSGTHTQTWGHTFICTHEYIQHTNAQKSIQVLNVFDLRQASLIRQFPATRTTLHALIDSWLIMLVVSRIIQ